MKREEINIRDPYVLVHDGQYYLYGTRSATAWGEADGFDCYVSRELQDDPLFPENGGHGMFFQDLEGHLLLTLHHPNDRFQERPCFWTITAKEDKLVLGEQA